MQNNQCSNDTFLLSASIFVQADIPKNIYPVRTVNGINPSILPISIFNALYDNYISCPKEIVKTVKLVNECLYACTESLTKTNLMFRVANSL